MTFEIGSTAYIVESNRIIREVTIVKRNGDFYIATGFLQAMKMRILPYIKRQKKGRDIVLHMTTYTKVNGRG